MEEDIGTELSPEEFLENLATKSSKTIPELTDDVVVLIGNTGSGKTTLSQFLAGNLKKLKSVLKFGDYIITEEDELGETKKISSITESCTFTPEIFLNDQKNLIYYDCPGFEDTRGPEIDLQNSYIMKKIIENVQQIKILILVNHTSLRPGMDRVDFRKLLKFTGQYIENIDKYEKSIALVVSKVENKYSNDHTLVKDEKVREQVVGFCKEVRELLIENSQQEDIKSIQLLEIFMTRKDDKFSKIGIFRRPEREGILSSLDGLKNNRNDLLEWIENQVQFTKPSSDDFGLAVSPETIIYNQKVFENVLKIVEKEVHKIMIDLLAFC